MSDPVLTLVVLAGFLVLMALMYFFKTLDGDLAAAWRALSWQDWLPESCCDWPAHLTRSGSDCC